MYINGPELTETFFDLKWISNWCQIKLKFTLLLCCFRLKIFFFLCVKQNVGYKAFEKCLGYYQFQIGKGSYNGLKYCKIKETPCKSYERVILPAFLDQRAGGRVGTSVRAPAAKAAEVTLPRNPACICRSARGRSWRSWRPRSRPYIDGRRPRSDDLRILPVSVERAAGRLVCGVRGRMT